ncbi:arf3-interacting protein [Anaeramoeba flamelloides]|uniref:Arf3-interacting protein n=1 Tax=Anaeramoeba flamelloides TaxID=1746091 RepID=A0ABQ8XCA7_9EUKA|nr:arf3-interacting protein [Anaeramoeba flamelloides]
MTNNNNDQETKSSKRTRNVNYILFGDFDAFSGNTVRCQYPRPCGTLSETLQELMIPDGLHNLEEDFTIFFLRRNNKTYPELLSTDQFIESDEEYEEMERKTKLKEESEKQKETENSEQNQDKDQLGLTKEEEKEKEKEKKIIEEKKTKDMFFVYFCSSTEESWSTLGNSKNWINFDENIKIMSGDATDGKEILFEVEWYNDLKLENHENNFYVFFDKLDNTIGCKFFSNEKANNFKTLFETFHQKKLEKYQSERNNNKREGEGQVEGVEKGNGNVMGKVDKKGHNDELRKGRDINLERVQIKEKEKEMDKIKENPNGPFLYCMCYVKTIKDDQAVRGTRYHALAIASKFQFISIFKPILMLHLDKTFQKKDSYEEIVADLYKLLNSFEIGEQIQLIEQQKQINRTLTQLPQVYTTELAVDNIQIPIRIPLNMLEDEMLNLSLISLVNDFQESIMVLFNAILMNKRIIFVGYELSAGFVCETVLSSILMVCPPLRGVIRRTFPYANLPTIGLFENVPGYIVGTTNPLFATKNRYWDVLCDVKKKAIQINPDLLSEMQNTPYHEYDQNFIKSVMYSITNLSSENEIRFMFQEYATHVLLMTSQDEAFINKNTQQLETSANQSRIGLLKNTDNFKTFLQDREIRKSLLNIKGMDTSLLTRQLYIKKDFGHNELFKIFEQFLLNINTEEQCLEFLSYFPESKGGLYPIAVNLFHSSEFVRLGVAAVLKRLDSIKTGSGLITGLNMFLLLAYERNIRYLGEKLEKFEKLIKKKIKSKN